MSRQAVPFECRVSFFLANDSDCEHHATQPKHVRDHPVPYKTSRKESEAGARGEHLELLQHKAVVLALAVIAATPLQR